MMEGLGDLVYYRKDSKGETYPKEKCARYNGEFKEDKKEGKGTFIWEDGRKFVGEWKEGKQHGPGSYTNARAETRKGIWKSGKLLKWIK